MKNLSVQEPVNGLRHTSVSIDPSRILQSIVDVVFVIDSKGDFLYVSPSVVFLLGYTPEEMTGHSFTHFIHPEDIEKTIQIASVKSIGGRSSSFENRYYRKDGTIVRIIWSGRWEATDGLLYCVARDASEISQIRDRLVKAQQMARVANYEWDVVSGSIAYASDTFYDIFGLDTNIGQALNTALLKSLIHPDDWKKVNRKMFAAKTLSNATLEYRIVKQDGRVCYISQQQEILFDKAGMPARGVATLQDITERILNQRAVVQNEEKFRTLVQNGNDFIGIIDEKGNYIFVTPNLKEHLGFQPDDLIGYNALQMIHHDDVAMVTQALQDMQNHSTMVVGPFRFKDGYGRYRWMETTVTNHLANPAIGGLVLNSRDITEKKQKEDELKRSEQQFKALVQNSSDLIVIMDENANFTYVSDNVLLVLGYQVEEMLGKNALDFINPEDVPKVAAEIEVLVANRKADGLVHRFLHKTKGWVWLESKGSNHLENECIQGILVNARNIDDRVKLQNRLSTELVNKQKEITAAAIKAQEAQRSQLGLELHDNVNQVLTTVKLYNEMYLTGLVQDKEVLVKSTQYIQDCINEIRSISKRLSAPTLGKISLRDSISELVDSINLTKRLTITYLPQFIDLCPISQDLHLAIYRIVQEGLNNIIKYANAKKAMVEIIRSNEGISLVISDDGKGFDVNSGSTGIGITNMKTRAENMNGRFSIESQPGKGCRIEILFPVQTI